MSGLHIQQQLWVLVSGVFGSFHMNVNSSLHKISSWFLWLGCSREWWWGDEPELIWTRIWLWVQRILHPSVFCCSLRWRFWEQQAQTSFSSSASFSSSRGPGSFPGQIGFINTSVFWVASQADAPGKASTGGSRDESRRHPDQFRWSCNLLRAPEPPHEAAQCVISLFGHQPTLVTDGRELACPSSPLNMMTDSTLLCLWSHSRTSQFFWRVGIITENI